MIDMVSHDPGPVAFQGTSPSALESDSLYYRARGASVDLHIMPKREGADLAICGRILPRPEFDSSVAKLNVEILNHTRVLASAAPNRDGVFQFNGLSCGVYHMHVSNGEWKIAVFGITA